MTMVEQDMLGELYAGDAIGRTEALLAILVAQAMTDYMKSNELFYNS